jgi:hypothetical protein
LRREHKGKRERTLPSAELMSEAQLRENEALVLTRTAAALRPGVS